MILNENKTKKLLKGLELAHKRMIEFKKYKNSPVIVYMDGKVTELSPWEVKPAKYNDKSIKEPEANNQTV